MKLGDRLMLILEDEPIIAFDLEDALLAEGAEVTVAATNDQALASIVEKDFGGAILDVNLHGETSYIVAHALRDKGIPFVFATGYGDAAHPAELAHVPTVTKPYSIDEIRRAFAAMA